MMMGENAVSDGNPGEKHCGGSSREEMDDKENFCAASGNELGVPVISKGTPQTRKIKKSGRCNLRKSLTWNKAFFTEEGVLDPKELSILSGTVTNSSGGFLYGIDEGGMSPLMSYGFSTQGNMGNKVRLRSQIEDHKDCGLSCSSERLILEDTTTHVAPGKATPAKDICRNIPRSPATYSQKRLANMDTTNPASKLPKFTATKSLASSLPLTSGSSAPTKKHLKCSKNVPPVNAEQTVRLKSSLLIVKKALPCPTSSAKSSGHILGKNMASQTSETHVSVDLQDLQVGKHASRLKVPSKLLFPTNFGVSVSNSGSGKVASLFSDNSHQISGGPPPAPVNPKPSGLRMPSPSLGFFGQAKVTPLSLKSQRNAQPCKTLECNSLSVRRPNSMKHMGELRSRHISHDHPPTLCSAAMKVSAVLATSSGNTEMFYCSSSSIVPIDTFTAVNVDLESGPSEITIAKNSFDCRISNCPANGQKQPSTDKADGHKQLNTDHLMADDNVEECSGKQVVGYEPEIPNHLALPIHNDSLLVDRFSNNSTNINGLRNSNGADLASGDSSGNQLANYQVLSQRCSPKQPQGGDSGVYNQVMHPQEEHGVEFSAVTCDNGMLDRNHEFMCGSNNLALPMDEGPLLLESRFSNKIMEINGLKNSNGVDLASGDSTCHQLAQSQFLSQRCASKQPQECDSGAENQVMQPQVELGFEFSTVACSTDVSDGNHEFMSGFKFGDTKNSTDQCGLIEAESTSRMSKKQMVDQTNNSHLELTCSSTEKLGSLPQRYTTESSNPSMGHNGFSSNFSSEETHSSDPADSELPYCGVPFEMKRDMDSSKDVGDVSPDKEKLVDSSKEGSVPLRLQLQAVPFSDEWVAALEAFGEDILEMKTGPVQNSPQDKPPPEPSPWSPVKRKTQDVGPFDCTKYIKNFNF